MPPQDTARNTRARATRWAVTTRRATSSPFTAPGMGHVPAGRHIRRGHRAENWVERHRARQVDGDAQHGRQSTTYRFAHIRRRATPGKAASMRRRAPVRRPGGALPRRTSRATAGAAAPAHPGPRQFTMAPRDRSATLAPIRAQIFALRTRALARASTSLQPNKHRGVAKRLSRSSSAR